MGEGGSLGGLCVIALDLKRAFETQLRTICTPEVKCCFRDNGQLLAATPLRPSGFSVGLTCLRTPHVDTRSLLMTCVVFYKTVRQEVESKRTQ